MRAIIFFLAFIGPFFYPAPTFAHMGFVPPALLDDGLLHYLVDLDDVLATIAVGLLASLIGDRALWLLPLAFMSAMLCGSLLTASGIMLPFTDPMIAISVMVLSFLCSIEKKLAFVPVLCITMIFGVFHGAEHGIFVAQECINLKMYGLSFIIATPFLLIIGILVGWGLPKWKPVWRGILSWTGIIAGITFLVAK